MPEISETPILITVEYTDRPIDVGEMVHASHVLAVNVVKDIREMATNILGGKMSRYEELIETALLEVKSRFKEQLKNNGYDGAIGVRIAHPQVVGGGAELIIYGTGFNWKKSS